MPTDATNERVIAEATFNPKVKTYWLLSGALVMVLMIVTIPLVPFWFLFGLAITQRYLDGMSCTLTDRALKVKRGVLTRQEKTVPLEKITDLGLVQGPIMRAMDLEALSVETAGGSATNATVRITGVEGTRAFRDLVLRTRDEWVDQGASASSANAAVAVSADSNVLVEIRDSLVRIEELIRER